MATRAAKTKAAAAPEPEPEVDLTELLDREPSEVNKAEAAWLIDCVGLEVDEAGAELAETFVMLVAGKAHREWQKSEAAATLHEEIRMRREEEEAEKAEAKAERERAKAAKQEAAEDEDEAPAPKRRGRPKAAAVEEPEDEEPAVAKPRRGRPKAAAPAPVAEAAAPKTRRPAKRAAAGGNEAPF